VKSFSSVKKLNVYRRFSDNKPVLVGQLAQNKNAVFFQYDTNYLNRYPSLSPFKLPFTSAISQAPAFPHDGLHGLFTDSLPDGWGMLLMDRIFQQHGISKHQLTAMDRLAFIGDRAMGSLSFLPVSEYTSKHSNDLIDVNLLGENAVQLFDGQINEVLMALVNAGSSGGARPKALIYLDPKSPQYVATLPLLGLEPWLIKFTSKNLMLGHEEGKCEAVYLMMAKSAGINVPDWKLIDVSSSYSWLATKRFDCYNSHSNSARYHIHSLCGLLDIDYRQPALDYDVLIKSSEVLCQSPAVGKIQFTRAMFNLFAANQDDHSKNWSFIMNDNGQWQPSPFYDVTFSPTPYNEHSTAFLGYGKNPPLSVIQALAQQANFSSWNEARNVIYEVVDAISEWSFIAKQLSVDSQVISDVSKHLDAIRKENRHLL
jgi:serine/threonine-protein kinase HipA